MIRVLHLAPTLGTGGAERQLYLLCRESRAHVEHSVVAARSEGRWAAPIRELGVEVRCLNTALRDPRLLPRVWRSIGQADPDIVHCWLPSMNVVGALTAGPRPVIASVRNVDDWKPWSYRMLDRLLAPSWTAVIANSHAGAAQFAGAAKLDSGVVHVVANGISERPAGPKSADARHHVLTACRLVRQKRVDRIVAAARSLPEFRFRIAGDGPERARLEQIAPANVEFLGEITNVGAQLDWAGFFMLGSEREGTSNALLEAMQAGCVPVATDAGDNARIVEDRISGRIAKPDELAGAVRECLPVWQEMSEAARKSAAQYTVPVMAERTLHVYRSLARAAGTNPLPRLH